MNYLNWIKLNQIKSQIELNRKPNPIILKLKTQKTHMCFHILFSVLWQWIRRYCTFFWNMKQLKYKDFILHLFQALFFWEQLPYFCTMAWYPVFRPRILCRTTAVAVSHMRRTHPPVAGRPTSSPLCCSVQPKGALCSMCIIRVADIMKVIVIRANVPGSRDTSALFEG